MRWTRQFLIVLTLSSLGCARGDWTAETLTLVDVTGTWEGLFRFAAVVSGRELPVRWVLRQNGAKVRGEVQGQDGAPIASIEGLVNSELFSWTLVGPFVRTSRGSDSGSRYVGESTVNSDELSGRADGMLCPCTFNLRRVSTEAFREKTQ